MAVMCCAMVKETGQRQVRQLEVIDPVVPEGEFQVWPNPNNGDHLSISLTGVDRDVEQADVVLYDATGRMVHHADLSMADGAMVTQLELGNIGTGVYALRVTAGGKTYESRVVVVNQ